MVLLNSKKTAKGKTQQKGKMGTPEATSTEVHQLTVEEQVQEALQKTAGGPGAANA